MHPEVLSNGMRSHEMVEIAYAVIILVVMILYQEAVTIAVTTAVIIR